MSNDNSTPPATAAQAFALSDTMAALTRPAAKHLAIMAYGNSMTVSGVEALRELRKAVDCALGGAKYEHSQRPHRTDAEIVVQTEMLASFLLGWRWGQEPEAGAPPFRTTRNVKAQGCWDAACKIQELLTDTDVENAVAGFDDAAPEGKQP
ncbi:hypothetical protein DEH84_06790 [Aquabacterium olei]|uniref:Uncharacterized protein n=1 Tax=Aquabacterium olei TaxID=1296669 RepID=A0A2U8FSB8_9BURK|nr:hypothetical protein [Aquabacterium olei]AWI53166.1 hypothetical protein DEH84_06790 [Aquabacterium olei]